MESEDARTEAPTSREALRPTPKRAWWVRAIAAGAVVLTAWQVFASFLWIAPYSPLREVVPGNALSSYMLPMFGQSWSVFAPEPINGDYHFNVRAILADGETETGWVSATDVELSMIRYNLFPPRAGIQSSEVASGFKDAYDALGGAQKDLVAGAYRGDDWETRMRDELAAGAVEVDGSDLGSDRASTEQVDAYLAQEHISAAYATQVARAIWGEDIAAVQFRVSRQNIVPFGERKNPDAQRPDPQMTESGWRELVVEPGQNDENFARTFRAQYERISG